MRYSFFRARWVAMNDASEVLSIDVPVRSGICLAPSARAKDKFVRKRKTNVCQVHCLSDRLNASEQGRGQSDRKVSAVERHLGHKAKYGEEKKQVVVRDF